ncbi:MAG: SUMF1/EgtB/PvdO family nonheme iron enzyme, partial [Bacteroidetes bacterium]|nr:SUMF1/EgtB/PvdO family nonheme iron enzyme [Bacteroidota bacterium]
GEDYYQYCADQELVKNPKGPEKGSDRVLRGGYWTTFARPCRVSSRYSYRPGDRFNLVGFRLALSLQSVG